MRKTGRVRLGLVSSVAATCHVPTRTTITAENIRDSMYALFDVTSWVIGRQILDTVAWHCRFRFTPVKHPLITSCAVNGIHINFTFDDDRLLPQCTETWTFDGVLQHKLPDGQTADMGPDVSVPPTMALPFPMTSFGAIYTPRGDALSLEQIAAHLARLGTSECLICEHHMPDGSTHWRCKFTSQIPYAQLHGCAINGEMPTLVMHKLGSAWNAFCKTGSVRTLLTM